MLGKLKVEQQQSKIKGQKVKEELDDEDNTNVFDILAKKIKKSSKK